MKRYTYKQLTNMRAVELDTVAMYYGLSEYELVNMRNSEIISYVLNKQAKTAVLAPQN